MQFALRVQQKALEAGLASRSYVRNQALGRLSERNTPTKHTDVNLGGLQAGQACRLCRMVCASSDTDNAVASKVEQDATVWMRSAGTLFLGSLGTNMLLASFSQQVLALDKWQIALLFLATDAVFAATSFKFLGLADAFDQDWHKRRVPYPGPAWGSSKGNARDSNQGREPFLFPSYVKLFLGVGGVVPLTVLLVSLARGEEGPLAAAVVIPYLLTLGLQVSQELSHLKDSSALWPIVPMHHMGYRFLQLVRSSWLVAALQGPFWMQWLIATLASLWFYNFGAVLTWQTSLYYFHRQPNFEETS